MTHILFFQQYNVLANYTKFENYKTEWRKTNIPPESFRRPRGGYSVGSSPSGSWTWSTPPPSCAANTDLTKLLTNEHYLWIYDIADN